MTGIGFKRFIVFCMPTYYPGGGSSDVLDSFDTIEEANELCARQADDCEIFDCDARTFSFPVLP